jgi:hypothetical protein
MVFFKQVVFIMYLHCSELPVVSLSNYYEALLVSLTFTLCSLFSILHAHYCWLLFLLLLPQVLRGSARQVKVITAGTLIIGKTANSNLIGHSRHEGSLDCTIRDF